MNLTVNGKSREVDDGSTVHDLIASLGYGDKQVVVERNGEPVARSGFGELTLLPGDVVEVVRAVPGG